MMDHQLLNGISIDWSRIPEDSYLRHIEAIHGVEMLSFGKPVTFFVGENGSGKSTLLEAALSPQRQLTMLMEIDRCVKEGSQFIIVTHSPILLGLRGKT